MVSWSPFNLRSGRGLRWRKAWRDLAFDRTRTLLVMLSIAVGVFAFGTIIGAGRLVNRELDRAYTAVHPANATFYTRPFGPELVETVRDMPAVAHAIGRRMQPTRVRRADGEWQELRLIAVDDYTKFEVAAARPETGAWPPPEQAVLIERNSLDLLDTAVGETITVQLPDGRIRRLPVAGTTHDMNQPPAQIFGIAFGYIAPETLPWLGTDATFNQLQIRVAGDATDPDHIRQTAAAVEHKLDRAGYSPFRIDIPAPDTHFAAELLPAILTVLGSLGVLSLLLSGFLIVNTLSALLTQQQKQIGVMKAIGARPDTIMGVYMRQVVLFGLGGLLPAVPLAAGGAFLLSRFIAAQLNFDIPTFMIDPMAVAVEIIVGLLIPIAAAVVPVRSAARLTIREAISSGGLNETVSTAPAAHRLARWWRERISRPLRLSLRNTFRRRGRLALTVGTLALGGAIFISVMTVRVSLFATLEDTLAERGFDIEINLLRPHRTAVMDQLLADIPQVTAVEGWRQATAAPVRATGAEGDSLLLNALPADTALFQPDLQAGRWLRPADRSAVIIHNNLLDKEPYLQLGGPLTLNIDGTETTWTIVGITQDLQPPIGPTNIYVTTEAYARRMGANGQTDSVRLLTAAHDAATHAAVTAKAEEALAAHNIGITNIRTGTDDRALFTERFNILTVLLTTMAVLIATVGSLGLMGTMTINVLERRREIGVMRAIGANDTAVIRLFLVESLLIGILSWLAAAVLAQPLSRGMAYMVGQEFLGFPLTYLFSFAGLGGWLLLVIVLSAAAGYQPSQQAAQISIRETLTYE